MVKQYLDHSKEILTSKYSQFKGGSKGVGLISLFGYQNEYDLREGFPLVTTKRTAYKSSFAEILWMLGGNTNIKPLVDSGIHIWDGDTFQYNLPGMVKEGIFPEVYKRNSPEWQSARDDYAKMIEEDSSFANRWGDSGRIYGAQWRKWRSVDGETGEVLETDQIQKLFDNVRKNPYGKKHIVTAWNPGELKKMSMPPCHMEFQINVVNEEELDLMMKQRSCDMFLGVPFNIAQYSMLTHIIAKELELKPRRFIHTFGDSHFYAGVGERSSWYGENFERFQGMVREARTLEDFSNLRKDLEERILPNEPEGQEGYDHVTAILTQLSREPKKHPRLVIKDKPFFELTVDDLVIEDYEYYPGIKRKMAA